MKKFLILPLLLAFAAEAQGDDLEARIEQLEKELKALKAELEAKREAERAPQGPKASFGGQYRINAYTVDNDTNDVVPDEDRQTAARLRIRQNIDLRFSEAFKTHLQLELQHTTDNVITTDVRLGGKETDVSVRHAVMDYTSGPWNLKAGIVPLSDRFGDALFSSDWDYNPLALALEVQAGPGKLRAFAANLKEGAENIESDDFVHYQLDYALPLGGGTLDAGATALELPSFTGSGDARHYVYGAGVRWPHLRAFLLGSRTDKALLGSGDDAAGAAAKVEVLLPLGRGEAGLMATYATGDSDGTGFLPPMAFAQTYGYWGYTGILTVQGPTDTGFDFDGVNISNNGYGLATLQARYRFPITPALTGYLAAGWFGHTDAPGRDDTLGWDLLAMGTYRFTQVLALDFGVAYASLNDSVSGYFQGVQGGAGFNQDQGVERDKLAIFSRLQAEF